MCPFWKRKKKKYTALKGKGCCEDECAGLADEVEDADDTAECQVVEPAAEEVPADEA